MNELWKAFVARLVYWLTPNPPLKHGICVCDHKRNDHVGGKGHCVAEFPPDSEWPHGARCACQIFVLAKDDRGGNGSSDTPSPAELERMFSK
jgi:hypothetical protein